MKTYFILIISLLLLSHGYTAGSDQPDDSTPPPSNAVSRQASFQEDPADCLSPPRPNKIARNKSFQDKQDKTLSAPKGPNRFDHLPNEIILHILSFLNDQDPGFKNFYLTEKRMNSFFCYAMEKRFHSCESLDITPIRLALLGQLPALSPNPTHYSSLCRWNLDNLQTLRICVDGLLESNHHQILRLVQILPSLSNLKEIKFFYSSKGAAASLGPRASLKKTQEEQQGAKLFLSAFAATNSKISQPLTLNLAQLPVRCFAVPHLCQALGQFTDLHDLNLSRTKLQPDNMILLSLALSSLPQLRHLNLEQTHLDLESIDYLATAFPYLKKLETLYLSQNHLDDDSAEVLAKGLLHLSSLKHLNLDTTAIGNSGVIRMVETFFSVKDHHVLSLESLNLQANDIHDTGAKALACLLHWLPKLQQLYLGFNNIGCAGAGALAQGLRHCPQLQTLSLQDNGIRQPGFLSILGTVNTLPHFQALECGENDLDTFVMARLKDIHFPHAPWQLTLTDLPDEADEADEPDEL